MNRITILPLAFIFGICLQPLSLYAQDQGQAKGDAISAGDSAKGGKDLKSGKHAGKQIEKNMASNRDAPTAKAFSNKDVNITRPTNAGTLNESNTRQSVQQTNRNQSFSRQSSTFAVHGNQSNHYNGQWMSADTHGDWDVHADHNWNHHQYRYYDGGWLIVDLDSAPAVDYGSGSMGSNVQARLAQQGYYHGPIDGEIGPGTRRAIAHYEVDNGMAANGVIDGPLLASLGLN
jgi:Putative peptidoglycan binding domain